MNFTGFWINLDYFETRDYPFAPIDEFNTRFEVVKVIRSKVKITEIEIVFSESDMEQIKI